MSFALADQDDHLPDSTRSLGLADVAASPVALAVLDSNLRYLFATDQHAEWLGLRPSEITGRALFELLPADAYFMLEPHLKGALAGAPATTSGWLELPAGGRRYLSFAFQPMLNPLACGIHFVMTDLTSTFEEAEGLRRSEATLRDFVENATVPAHWVGPDGTILWANRAELDLLGYGAEEYVGRDIRSFHVDRAVVDDILARLSRGECIRERRLQLRRGDGSVLEVLLDSSAYLEAGRFVHTRGFTRDATDLRRAESANAHLAAIVASSQDAIVGKTTQGIITSWNSAAERMFGHSADEAIGNSIALIVPEHRRDDMDRILGAIRRGERVQHFETERVRKDGAIIHVSLTVSPILDAFGSVVGASKIARDITERMRQERQLRLAHEQVQLNAAELQQANETLARRTAELELANAELSRFASLVSHDLKTPLRAIRQYADFIAMDIGDTARVAVADYLDKLFSSVLHAEQMIDGLLNMSRVGMRPVSLERLDIAELVTAMLPGLRLPEGASVHVTGHGYVDSDAAVLRLAFQDLILNGLKFNESASPRVDIEIEDQPDAGGVQVCVTDNGIGIEPRHRDRVFDIFERLHGPKYEGTGIGLAVVRKAVSRLGGDITIEAAPGGQGTRFCIWLPSGVRGDALHRSS